MEESAKKIAARAFLKRGRSEDLHEKELADACDRFIQEIIPKSVTEARHWAELFIRRAGRDNSLRPTAYRVMARVNHFSGKHREALKFYLKARNLVLKEPAVRARIDRMLIDVYMYLGNYKKARIHSMLALRTFVRLGLESDIAQTRVNFANLLHRQDRHRDAEKLYRQAAEFFEKSGNMMAAARCYYNRANTLVQLFDFGAAERLYGRALKIRSEAGLTLEAANARYGLAWLRMLEGKFHEALVELSVCEEAYRAGGDPRGEALCILDRAETYLGLGLYQDALFSARKASRLFERMGLEYESAKAALFRSEAALRMGYKNEAEKALLKANGKFRKQDNRGFLGVVHLVSADLDPRSHLKHIENLRKARRLFEQSQLPLWEAVCDLKMTADNIEAEKSLVRLAANPAASVVPHLYTAWQTAWGDARFAEGKSEEARNHWRLAADRLDNVRSQLPPLELRGAYAGRFSSPHRRLIAIEMSRDPQSAAVWSERYKTAGLWSPIALIDSDPARQRVRESLARLANEVAWISGKIADQPRAGIRTAAAGNKSLSRLQRLFREELVALEKGKGPSAVSQEKLAHRIRDLSYRMPIVQFHLDGHEIAAFVHHRGETALRRFPDGRPYLAVMMQRWQFILESEILSRYLTGQNRPEAETGIWRELGKKLWSPLGVPGDCEKILVIPEGELANLPWEALIVDESPLAERHNFIISPSIRHFLAAENRRIISKKVEIFGGQDKDLPEVSRELDTLAVRAGKDAVIHAPCRRDDWPSSGEADIWHFSGHAVLRADNPFYSYLSLDNGPIFAADFRMKNCRVNLVTLAACHSGREVAMPGEESTGMVRSLLEMGARNIIASRWPVSDQTTAIWMGAFYDRYFSGNTVLEAIRYASKIVRDRHPSAFHWAAFAIFGAGNTGE